MQPSSRPVYKADVILDMNSNQRPSQDTYNHHREESNHGGGGGDYDYQQQHKIKQRVEVWIFNNKFISVATVIVLLEFCLGFWPIVATVLWKGHAVDTWIHFLWWIKAFFLCLAVCQAYWAKKRKYKRWHNIHNTEPKIKNRYISPLTTFDLCVGATASCELSTWIMINIVGHALISSIVLLLVLVLRNEFLSNTEWILSLIFNAVAIFESIVSPILVTTLSLQSSSEYTHQNRRYRRENRQRQRLQTNVSVYHHDDNPSYNNQLKLNDKSTTPPPSSLRGGGKTYQQQQQHESSSYGL